MERESLDEIESSFGDVQLATLAKEAPHTNEWTYELKWDGYRIVALKSGARVRLLSRKHQDWTETFREIAREVGKLPRRELVLDGEICALDERGVPSFQRLQNRARAGTRLVYFVFDLLMEGGEDLRAHRFDDRRRRLEAVLSRTGKQSRIVLSQAFEGDPSRILRTACDAGLEGIVAKRKSARYAAASRAATWLKIECTEREPEKNEVLGVRLSHPERVLDPAGVTKLALARYYEAIGPWMLPHVKGRPLTLVRWAEGKKTDKGGVYLRHARAWGPKELRRVRIREKTKVGEYLVVDTIAALVALAQMDILEIHTWNATTDDLEHPDRLVFDLDPGQGVPWREVVDSARHVKRTLASLELESFVKTTGGKGLHVVVPLRPSLGWAECLELSRSVVRRLAREKPERYVLSMSKSIRRGRIYVDYLRNGRANTSVAAYSIRARPGAPVSVPLAWDELDSVDPASFTIDTVVERVKRMRRDPW